MSSQQPEGSREDVPSLATMRTRAVRGSLWWAGLYPASKAIQIGSSMVLAALLSPATFGVIAVASVVVRGIHLFSEVGIQAAVVQSERTDTRFVNTAWTMQLLRATLICLVAAALAYPMADLYEEEQLGPILLVLGVGTILSGFQSTKWDTLGRNLQERPRALLDLANSFVTRSVMILVAYCWPSAWAIVVGTLAGSLFHSIATQMLPGPCNRLAWDPTAVRSLLRFGSWIFVGTAISFVSNQADTLLLGKLVSDSLSTLGLLGVYEMSQRVARLPQEAAHLLGGNLAFPILAEVVRQEPTRIRERLMQVRESLYPLGMAGCMLVVVAAPWFFDLCYDERYAAARWMAGLSMVAVWVRILNGSVNHALLAMGCTRFLAISGGLAALGLIAGGLLGFYYGGIPGFIVGVTLGDILRHVSELIFLARRGIDIHSQDVRFLFTFLPPALLCGLCHAWSEGSSAWLLRWGVGVIVPGLVLLVTCTWAARHSLRVLRRA